MVVIHTNLLQWHRPLQDLIHGFWCYCISLLHSTIKVNIRSKSSLGENKTSACSRPRPRGARQNVLGSPFPTGIRMVCSPAEPVPTLASCLSWLAGMVSSVCCEVEPPEWIFSSPAKMPAAPHRSLETHWNHTAGLPLRWPSSTCLASSCSDSAHQ